MAAFQAGSALADDGGVETIVVTALKRDTNIQQTPISISAVTGDTLANAGIQDISNLTQQVPSLTFVNAGPAETQLVIRGIQSSGEPTVGLYYDETPVTGAVGGGSDAAGSTPLAKLFDVERVEVLRGPQGTLYGSGSMGGTVRVIFNKPDFDYGGAVDVDLTSTQGGGNGYDVEAMGNIPIVDDKLAARAVVYGENVGGYVDNTYLHENNVNEYHDEGGRFMLRYVPTSHLTIDGSIFYQGSEGQVPTWLDSAGAYNSTSQTQLPESDDLTIYNVTARWDFGWVVATAIGSYLHRQVDNTSGDVSYALDTFFNNPGLCSAFGYGSLGQCATPGSSQITAWNTYVGQHVPSALYIEQSVSDPTAEFRLSSAGDNFLDWTVGAFYSDRTTHGNNREIDADPATGALDGNTVYQRLIYDELKEVAGYGEASAHVTDALTLTFGARYFDYTRDVGGATPLGLNLVGAATTPYAQVSSGQSGWVTKSNVSYQFDHNIMFYADASQGFRPGGVNQVLGLPSALTPYSSDSLWDYEVGTKTSWFSNRLVVDLDGYLIDWNNMQVTGKTPNGAFSFITNAGAAQVKGLEAEVTAEPIDNLQIQANGALSRAVLTQNQVNANVLGPGVVGNYVPYVPKFTSGASAQYTWSITDDFGGMARIDESYVGSSFSEFNNSNHFDSKIPAYALTNIRVGIEGPDGGWGFYLYANNLFNRDAILYANSNSFTLGQTLYTSAPPRVFGLNFRKNF
ncbi:MAG TPA: TonB-dependent receptor [Xanthobacteraceae bacterium]|nr:TonB-dependent receptor [Xanthobacteraceae bacterium]